MLGYSSRGGHGGKAINQSRHRLISIHGYAQRERKRYEAYDRIRRDWPSVWSLTGEVGSFGEEEVSERESEQVRQRPVVFCSEV